MTDITINMAIRIWISDKGYRTINSYMLGNRYGKDYPYFIKNNKNVEYKDISYKTKDVISKIEQCMKPRKISTTYYRGDNKNLINQGNFITRTFLSTSTDEEQAKSFIDGDCCLFKIIVDKDVKRYNTGVEYEVLLEKNVEWTYLEKSGKYHLAKIMPSNKKTKLSSSLMSSSKPKNIKTKFNKGRITRIIKLLHGGM